MRGKCHLRPFGVAVTAFIVSACGSSYDSNPPSASANGPAFADSAIGLPNAVAAPPGITVEKIDSRLQRATGPVDVWVTMEVPSVAAQQAQLAGSTGEETAKQQLFSSSNKAALAQPMEMHRSRLNAQHAQVAMGLASVGAEVLARVHVAHNAIAVRIDASQVPQIALIPGVTRVRPVINYKLDLSETVPYVGGAAAQAAGKDGTGIKVAVLDSGIDYTHRNLGGEGTLAAYAAAYGAGPGDPLQTTLDGHFPTAKVVGGYDFVGESWTSTSGALAPDPDPIDFQGHGSHVADIIAGKSQDGTHVGMAPGATLLAIKTCSAVATSCSGVALLQAVDFALDPNGDGDIGDSADVIHLSLGSDYGQSEDDLTFALENAVDLGIVVVASAGNGSNKPYVIGTPSIGQGIISVAQTQVPSATATPLVVNSPPEIAGVYSNTQTLEWSAVGVGVTGDVVFIGRGCPADSIAAGSPADPLLANPAGKIALIDRGACSASLKVDYAVDAGATGVLIGLVAPGDAISFSFGGGDSFAPALVIQQSLSINIKVQLSAGTVVNASIDPAVAIPLVGGMASGSSRGPSSRQDIKPEIGAPGASISAQVGTGDGETAFGGTSGAAPMVSGAVALILQRFPNRSPARIKAMLMNSANTNVYTNPALLPGGLAPITRIGAGELRVNRALALKAIAWNPESESAALAFGAVDVPNDGVFLNKKVRVVNLSNSWRTYQVSRSFRYAEDEASGAVSLRAPSSVSVGPWSRTDFLVKLVIKGSKLPNWALNGGNQGGNGAALNGPEYDGYLTLTSGSEKLSLPWHVLPRKASATLASPFAKASNGIKLANLGVETGDYDVFSLTGSSPRVPKSELPDAGDDFALIDLESVGVRHLPAAVFGADYLEFAISTHGQRAHPAYPAEFDVYIDNNSDGIDDYVVFNAENGGFSATGQTLVFVLKLGTTTANAFFFADADLNSGNAIFTVPASAVGVLPGTTFGFSVYAFDNYFTGFLTDAIEGMLFTPGNSRYSVPGGIPWGAVAPGSDATQPFTVASVPDASSSESAILLMYRKNALIESQTVKVQ